MSKKVQRASVTHVSVDDGTLQPHWSPIVAQQYSEADDRQPAAEPMTPSSPPEAPDCLCKFIGANLAADAEGYKTTHVELKLTSTEADFLARLRCGLSNGHVQLADGRHVETAPQSLRWLIQQAMHHTTHLGS